MLSIIWVSRQLNQPYTAFPEVLTALEKVHSDSPGICASLIQLPLVDGIRNIWDA